MQMKYTALTQSSIPNAVGVAQLCHFTVTTSW